MDCTYIHCYILNRIHKHPQWVCCSGMSFINVFMAFHQSFPSLQNSPDTSWSTLIISEKQLEKLFASLWPLTTSPKKFQYNLLPYLDVLFLLEFYLLAGQIMKHLTAFLKGFENKIILCCSKCQNRAEMPSTRRNIVEFENIKNKIKGKSVKGRNKNWNIVTSLCDFNMISHLFVFCQFLERKTTNIYISWHHTWVFGSAYIKPVGKKKRKKN